MAPELNGASDVPHEGANSGCLKAPERYGPNPEGWFLHRCRDCNVEWWDRR